MRKVILTKGLPGSGKSTWARQLLRKKKGAWVRVSAGELRAMCFGEGMKGGEVFLEGVRDRIILQALKDDRHVIVDDCHLSDDPLQQITKLVGDLATVEVEDRFLKVSVEDCIKQDLQRPNSVGEKTIRRMYRDYLKSTIEPLIYQESLPDCIVVDMDGTLALFNGRSPYEAQKCDTDLPNGPVVETVKKWQETVKVVVCSGRTDDARAKSVAWLKQYGIKFDALHMRRTGDLRKDSVVKEEIYRAHIEGKYNVQFVLDDRNQVVELWRGLGLTVFQVAEGDF